MIIGPPHIRERVARARRHGFHTRSVVESRFRAKPGSHDDGPNHGLFLGPIGGPAFSRDLRGRFSRWHLEPGMHQVTDIDSAFFAIHWSDASGDHHARLHRGDADEHEICALHPLSLESFRIPDAPFTAHLTAFSPLIPGHTRLSALPVVVFDLDFEPAAGHHVLPPLDAALFWPNLNGWRASQVTTTDRGDVAWPGQHHAGNVNVSIDLPFPGAGVVQSRIAAAGRTEAMCGDVALTVSGDADSFSRQVQFMVGTHETGVPRREQQYTLDAVSAAFATHGRLGRTPDGSWPAHWHEPVGSAVAAHSPGGKTRLHVRFVLAFDWPVVHFGQGRHWLRKYADRNPQEQDRARPIAVRAQRDADTWLAWIDAWHENTIDSFSAAGWPPSIAGCAINELNLVTSLGSAWVWGNPDDHRPHHAPGSETEHLGLLEGFDTGYFYYNTSDLWHYAFPGLSTTWPDLADLVFGDLAAALDMEVPTQRPIYRPAAPRPLLLARKLPHDLGCPAEDPFVRVNGYSMRDDPNTWRDANPAFVLATVVHHRLVGRRLDDATWRRLVAAAEVTAEQAGTGCAVPRHDEFGDSTWDNLGLRGYSAYTTGLCAGMWAVLIDESTRRGGDTGEYVRRLRGTQHILDELWNGRFFRAASEGKYVNAIMPDSLIGIFYADLCGARMGYSATKIADHLRSGYEIAYRRYHDAAVGPLLIAEEAVARHERDGGQELQVNEVVVGSAWLFTAMLRHYGLVNEARTVAQSLRGVLYGHTGLQFRTPAAVDADGNFRAPLNMRPLAVWWLVASAALAHSASGVDP